MAGGWGWGTVDTSVAFLAVIAVMVIYLTVSKANSIAPETNRS